MSRYFPHTPYAEDQPLSHTILYTHVLTRGLTAGTLIGTAVATARHYLPSSSSSSSPKPLLAARVLRASSTGALVGVGLSALATVGRMWGRTEIEWQDRSWRLMENRGQLRVDDWTYGGMVVAPVITAARGNLGWRPLVGAVGLGSVGGMVVYLATSAFFKEEKKKGRETEV